MIPGLAVALLAVAAGFLVHLLLPEVPQLTVCVVLGVIAGQIPAAARLARPGTWARTSR